MAISSVQKPLVAEPVAPSVPWFSQVPTSILVSQLFLAGGWLRAATSHGLSADWWSGQEILNFTEAHADLSITGYSFLVNSLIEPFSATIAAVVLAAQVLIGISLLLNWRPLAALTVGAFLNLHFILAGAVNPSVFYLVLALVIGSWRLDQVLTQQARNRLARRALWVGLLSTALLVPTISTITPDQMVEDPALVLIFLLLLGVVATRSLKFRMSSDDEEVATAAETTEAAAEPEQEAA